MICSVYDVSQVYSKFLEKRPISTTEWLFFLRGVEAGKGVLDSESTPCPAWVEKLAWELRPWLPT